jgi:hypothetical protein
MSVGKMVFDQTSRNKKNDGPEILKQETKKTVTVASNSDTYRGMPTEREARLGTHDLLY